MWMTEREKNAEYFIQQSLFSHFSCWSNNEHLPLFVIKNSTISWPVCPAPLYATKNNFLPCSLLAHAPFLGAWCTLWERCTWLSGAETPRGMVDPQIQEHFVIQIHGLDKKLALNASCGSQARQRWAPCAWAANGISCIGNQMNVPSTSFQKWAFI